MYVSFRMIQTKICMQHLYFIKKKKGKKEWKEKKTSKFIIIIYIFIITDNTQIKREMNLLVKYSFIDTYLPFLCNYLTSKQPISISIPLLAKRRENRFYSQDSFVFFFFFFFFPPKTTIILTGYVLIAKRVDGNNPFQ